MSKDTVPAVKYSESDQSAYQETLAVTKTALWTEDSHGREYFLHLFAEEFLDAFIAETLTRGENSFERSPWKLLLVGTYQLWRRRRNIFLKTITVLKLVKIYVYIYITTSELIWWNSKNKTSRRYMQYSEEFQRWVLFFYCQDFSLVFVLWG